MGDRPGEGTEGPTDARSIAGGAASGLGDQRTQQRVSSLRDKGQRCK